MVLFTQPDEIDTMDLDDAETTPDENHQDNGASPPLNTQPSSLQTPLTDALVDLYEPPTCSHIDARDAAHLARAEDLGSQRHALWGIPGLSAPKSWKPYR